MSEPAVLNWDRIIHKNVRSKDFKDVGNVFAIAGDDVTVKLWSREYNIPKTCVEGFKRSEVFLNINFSELSKYEVKF
jgi:hypothetical protein